MLVFSLPMLSFALAYGIRTWSGWNLAVASCCPSRRNVLVAGVLALIGVVFAKKAKKGKGPQKVAASAKETAGVLQNAKPHPRPALAARTGSRTPRPSRLWHARPHDGPRHSFGTARLGRLLVRPDGPWTHRDVAANGARFHIAEMGDGPLVLLLHGFPQFWWTWRHQLAALADAGFRAVAMDLRGRRRQRPHPARLRPGQPRARHHRRRSAPSASRTPRWSGTTWAAIWRGRRP